VDSHVGEIGRSGFRVFQRITRDATLVALVEAGMVAFDYSVRAIVPIPEAFKTAVLKAQDTRMEDDNKAQG
jgi:acyl-CoA thioesterase FadM